MDGQHTQWQESDALIAASWARIFEREAEWAVDAATRDAALERAAEARAHAAQLRQAQDKPPGPARVSLTGAERAAAPAEAETCPSCRGTGTEWYQARDGEYNQAACSACGNGRVGSRGTGLMVTRDPREQAARADDERARQRQAQKMQAAAVERGEREAGR